MFPPARGNSFVEARQQVFDAAGAALLGLYGGGTADTAYGLNAPELVGSLQAPVNSEAVRRQARWQARACPYISRFLETSIRRVLPTMDPLDVPPDVAEWWQRTWRETPIGKGGETGEQLERRAWLAYCVDGEFFCAGATAGEIDLIAADAVELASAGGDDQLPYPIAWKVRGRTVAAAKILHVAHMIDIESVRGRPVIATALPASRSRIVICANAGLGASIMSRLIGLLKTGAGAGLGVAAGAQGLGVSGLAGAENEGDAAAALTKQFPPGSLPTLVSGMEIDPVKYGLPDAAKAQVELLIDEIAAALHVSRALLDGDISRSNFASLRAGYAADQATFDYWCRNWVCAFRVPMFRMLATDAIARRDLPATAAGLTPDWRAPLGGEPNPEKELAAIKAAAELGLAELEAERLRRNVPAATPHLQVVNQ